MNMTELDKIIRSRKSTYQNDYSQDVITKEELEQILSVAPFAPNHKKTMPWRFHVFQGKSKDELAVKLAELYKNNTDPEKYLADKETFFKAKADDSNAIIAIVHNISQSVPEWEEHAAIAMAVQNMWLKATELGIGAYWSTMGQIRHIDEFLQLDENQNCIGLFFMGKTNTDFEIKEKDWKQFVVFRE